VLSSENGAGMDSEADSATARRLHRFINHQSARSYLALSSYDVNEGSSGVAIQHKYV
jgi:hypothetical protein